MQFTHLAYKRLKAIVRLIFSVFSNHLFLMENLFFPVKITDKRYYKT